MLPPPFAAFLLFFIASVVLVKAEDFVLDKETLDLAIETVKLNSDVYFTQTRKGYDKFKIYSALPALPDKAFFAQRPGKCFLGVRATNALDPRDAIQNIPNGFKEVCKNSDPAQGCCKAHANYHDVYYLPPYLAEMEKDIRECVATNCPDGLDNCFILSGWSQGGAVAAMAAVILADLNPRGFTFGAPSALYMPCEHVKPDRWIRFVNSINYLGLLFYDFAQVQFPGQQQYGHFVLLSTDTKAVKYFGLNKSDRLWPISFIAHLLGVRIGRVWGYATRLRNIKKAYEGGGGGGLFGSHTPLSYPVDLSGFSKGSSCRKDVECGSGKCHFFRCK